MQHTEDYVQYDVRLPNRSLLILAITVGWVILAAGVATLIWQFFMFMKRPSERPGGLPDPFRYCDTPGIDLEYYAECRNRHVDPVSVFSAEWLYEHWYVGFIALAVGIFIAWFFYKKHYHYYRSIRQGKILARDIGGGGNYPLEWKVQVEGNTYANEFGYEWRYVNAGYWHEAQVGDWFDSRK